MRSLAKKYILAVKPYVPGKPIDEVKRELGLKDVIKLASNENPYGPSAKVLKAIAKEAKSINRYPDGGCFYLRKALAKRLKVGEEQLIFGNGSDEIIVMAIKAFVEKGENVVVAKPSFLIYDIAARLAGATVKAVPLNNFRYDLAGMKKKIDGKTKIIFIGNPDNPAGTYLTKKEILKFLAEIPKRVLVFFDEAYFEYVRGSDYPDTLKLLKKYKNVIVTRTFSKMYGLAGLRVGYGMAPAETIDVLNRIREPFNVNSIAQAAALACLEDPAYYKDIARKFYEQKNYLYAQFKRLRLSFVESATNFILINVKKDSTKVVQQLLRKGVIVRDMNFWGLKGFIRVTVGTKQENQKLIKALGELHDRHS